jgi:1-acyl-sn-glycerol-3-phosphate acyltransferase
MNELAGTSDPQGLPDSGLRTVRRFGTRWIDRKYDVHQRGEGHVPASGPVILASNHIGWLDGPLIFLKSPRPPHALVKHDAFTGATGRLLRYAAQIPVHRGRTDAGALRSAARALAAGQVVAVYPEGRRGDGELHVIKGGVAWLALISGAPVVPVAIFGSREAGADSESRPPKGARIDVVYGDAIQFPAQPWPRTSEMIEDVTEQIREHMIAHLDWAKSATRRGTPGPLPKGSTVV